MLPSRNEMYNDSDCFYVEPNNNSFEELENSYFRKTSQEANNIKRQYFSIEEELLNSFKYVNPVASNLKTSSVKFATIIRESSNLFEQVSRIIYDKLYRDYGRINIFNYLTLDRYIKFNDLKFHSPSLSVLASESPTLLQPFKSINNWKVQNELEPHHIPSWWIAYNKIKHSPDSLTEYSTLENSIKSLLAAFITINRYLGPGVISGSLLKPEKNGDKIIQNVLPVEQSKLFIDASYLFGYSF